MKIIKKETVYQGFFKVDNVVLEHNGETFTREIYRNKYAVAALVYDTANKQYILTEQFRVAAEGPLQEVVAGLIDKENESPEETIKREIMEEIGYETDLLKPISTFYTSPGACAEKIYLFYAEVSRKEGAGGGVENEQENIRIVSLSREQLLQRSFIDAKTIIAVQWLQTQAS